MNWKTSERKEQKALVEWAGYKSGEIPALKLLLHVPNGGNRTARAGARMKAMGAKRGVLDLVLPVMQPKPAGGTYGALWIEMKSESGRLTKPQKWWRDNLLRIGHAHVICRSWTEGRDTLLAYLEGTLKTP